MLAFNELPLSQQAGMICNSPQFCEFAALREHFTGGEFLPGAAAEFLRRQCGITSRRELDTNETAARKFRALMTDFDEWRGFIQQRR
jgi:hypothetical protein